MTIRFTCPGCESVLKIKDEKAGTDAKCPKCKRPFVVPQPEDDDDGIEIEAAPSGKAAAPAPADLPIDLPVDMPIELTPEVPAGEEFDPADVLNFGRPAARASAPSPAASQSVPPDRRPSIAELMKDYESTKKKDKSPKKAESAKSAPSAAETTSSAADVLARSYQQKRDAASAPPPLSRTDARAAEQRAVAIEFVKSRLLPGLAAFFVVAWGYSWYMNREIYDGPPLFEVSGVVTKSGQPLAGVRVEFGPEAPGSEDQVLQASAITDEQGRFRLSAFAGQYGAPAGNYVVGLSDQSGVPLQVPEDDVRKTVSDTAPNEFEFKL
jgi:hypothetical protein